jgi:hypothetical protein
MGYMSLDDALKKSTEVKTESYWNRNLDESQFFF